MSSPRSLIAVAATLIVFAAIGPGPRASADAQSAVQPRVHPTAGDRAWLGAPTRVAEGVELYRVDTPHADPPRSLRLLRLDPTRVRLASALATGEIPGRATVATIVKRTGALAGVNAGFFSPTGDPNGLLKIEGRLVSDTARPRGAVALFERDGRLDGIFDRATARVRLRVRTGTGWRTVAVDGVDTVRGRGRLVLYTPASGPTTDTTGGLEWVLRPGTSGSTLVAGPVRTGGNASIPADGVVVSYGGDAAPARLGRLAGATVQVREVLVASSGERQRDWLRAPTIVGGAGLLLRAGVAVQSWTSERLSRGFETTPHPRTVMARSRDLAWWLITVDGRQPGRAIGMSFTDLQVLLSRLGVTDALNLDGGGSTTMVVRGEVVNRPSDLIGPRPVSDALLVFAR